MGKNTNTSVPAELLDALDEFISSDVMKKLGINSRRSLIMILFQIINERYKALGKHQGKIKSKRRPINVSIPIELANEMDEIARSQIARSLWMGEKTKLLGEALRHLIAEQNAEYAEFLEMTRVTVNDLERYMKRQKIIGFHRRRSNRHS